MGLLKLNRFAPGLLDDTDQQAETIINIDTGDADETGMPIDTSDVPEADVAEGQAEAAAAVETATTVEDTADAVDAADDVVEALEAIASQRRGMTRMEASLVARMISNGTSRLYSGASPSDRATGYLGAGIESADEGGYAYVLAALEESKTGVVETIKKMIEKVKDFFKGIYKAITKFLSGTKKIKTRAAELKKRAGDAKTDSGKGKVKVSGSGITTTTSGVMSYSVISSHLSTYAAAVKSYLVDGTGISVLSKAVELIDTAGGSAGGTKDDDNGKLVQAFRAQADELGKNLKGGNLGGATGGTSSRSFIGGLQVGVIANFEEFKVTLFAKSMDPKEVGELDCLTKANVGNLADDIESLIDNVIAYQDGWKKREDSRNKLEKALKDVVKSATDQYNKNTDDKVVARFRNRRKLATSVSTSMISMVTTESRLISHSVRVSNSALSWCASSLKALNNEDKKATTTP